MLSHNEHNCGYNSKKHNHNNKNDEIKCCKCHDESHEHAHSCGCSGEGGAEAKSYLYYIIGAMVLLLAFLGELGHLPLWVSIPCAVAVYGFFGADVWIGAYNNIIRKKFFTEFTLMCVATLGAVVLGEFADAAAVMYLYSLGESISGEAYSRSRKNISKLIEITEENVTVVKNGVAKTMSAGDVKVGDVISVRVGDKISLDGVVVEGSGYADTSAVTGEEIPRELIEGGICLSGSTLISGAVFVKVTSPYRDSTANKLKKAVEIATKRKAVTEKKITRFAELFIPCAFGFALVVFVGSLIAHKGFGDSLRSFMVVLVASCPCSLVLSVPLAYFSGIGRAAGRGIVFRSGQTIDNIARIGTIVFDKTGTLTTKGQDFIGVRLFEGSSVGERQLLDISKAALIKSPHSSARAFCEKYTRKSHYAADQVRNIGGRGLVCRVGGMNAAFGNRKMMNELGIKTERVGESAIFVALDGRLCGALLFSSGLKPNALGEVSALRGNGVERVAIMSGDSPEAVKRVADQLGIKEFYSELKPDEKLEGFEKIYAAQKKKAPSRAVAFCGDGLNDSAVIARADVGIAMGSGSAFTVESADVVIVDDDLARLNDMFFVAKETVGIAEQNIVISLGIKAIVVFLGIFAFASLELAVIADVGATVLTVINSARAGRRK